MECWKFSFLLVAVAVAFLATTTPIIFAARNEVLSLPLSTNDVANIRNLFANIFWAQKPAENCADLGEFCNVFISCCTGECVPGSIIGIFPPSLTIASSATIFVASVVVAKFLVDDGDSNSEGNVDDDNGNNEDDGSYDGGDDGSYNNDGCDSNDGDDYGYDNDEGGGGVNDDNEGNNNGRGGNEDSDGRCNSDSDSCRHLILFKLNQGSTQFFIHFILTHLLNLEV
ncbi:hypothetical protein PTKIN_Ptkin16aG0084400 [Pterospermum kingtungense]